MNTLPSANGITKESGTWSSNLGQGLVVGAEEIRALKAVKTIPQRNLCRIGVEVSFRLSWCGQGRDNWERKEANKKNDRDLGRRERRGWQLLLPCVASLAVLSV